MLQCLYDIFWLGVIYGAMYRGALYLLQEHPHLFKVVFDVDFRFHNFGSEMSLGERHRSVHGIVSALSFCILAVNPVVHSLIFIWLGFLDVVLLNRILLYVNLLKLGSGGENLNPMFFVQLIFTVVNYENRSILMPALFQLVDEAFDVTHVFRHLVAVYETLVGNDTRMKSALLSICVYLHANARRILRVRVGLLFAIAVNCLIFSRMDAWGEVIFYYYAAGRIFMLYKQNPNQE